MAAFDDVDLDLDRSERWSTPPARRRPGVVLAVAVLVVAFGVLAWWFTRERPAAVTGGIAAPAPVEEAAPLTATAPRTSSLPPLDALDPALRELVRSLTASPLLERWLSGQGLARQIVALVEGSGTGTLPLRLLSPLRPAGTFQVESRNGRTVIAAASHARFDALADVVLAVDARAFAEAYHTLSPRLEEAHDELGVAGSFDESFRRSLDRLVSLRVPEGPLAVVPHGGNYAFADPSIEGLSQVEKLLLRAGPDNARRIQQHLREIRDALNRPAAPTE
jgi:hypothetical protein